MPFVEIRHHRSRRLSAHPSRVVVLVTTLATQRPASSLKARSRDQTEPARWLNHFVQSCIQCGSSRAGDIAGQTIYCDRMTAPDPIRPICQTPLARERQTRTMQPDITQTAVTEEEFDVWVCPKDRSHEPELHITDV